MTNYLQMSKEELLIQKKLLETKYQEFCDMNLNLDMSRGKPAPIQLDLAMDMLNNTEYKCENGFDTRNYGLLEGIPEAREFFAEIFGCDKNEVIVGGSASLQLMYIVMEMCYRLGVSKTEKAWKDCGTIKFLCPAPGYDRHFRITEHFGFELITIPMTENGPDMDIVENLVANDESIKGIWCVPKYSNPDGYTYSDETVKRFAKMQTKASDFRIFWDNAYLVHDIRETSDDLLHLLTECKKQGTENRVFEFCSTSKISFAGAGISALSACEENIKYILDNMFPMLISFDKVNQLRHVKYFKNLDGVKKHMQKHRAILEPKFDKVLEILNSELSVCGDMVNWTTPNGGYFISLYAPKNTAKNIVALCKKAGVVLTGAGAAYPYGKDENDSNIRIAPSFPPIDELTIASQLLATCVKLEAVNQLLNK